MCGRRNKKLLFWLKTEVSKKREKLFVEKVTHYEQSIDKLLNSISALQYEKVIKERMKKGLLKKMYYFCKNEKGYIV